MALRRIMKELNEFEKDTPHYVISINPVEDDVFHLKAQIAGPPDSPYEGAVFGIDIKIPSGYPFDPPTTKFNPPIFHANVSHDGEPECFPLQHDKWAPAITIKHILGEIYNILQHPHKDLCLGYSGDLYIKDTQKYYKKAREYTLRNNMD